MKLRQCAQGLYKNDDNPNEPLLIKHEGDKYRTEEDMADIISFLAISDKTVLFECSLLEPTFDGESYKDPSLFNPMVVDTHSAPLLRVLQESIHKRIPLPNSCETIIDAYQDNFRFEPCF